MWLCLCDVRAIIVIADGVNEEEYREPELEPEEPYREQELPEGFEDGKFNLILWLHISTQFYKHNLSACFTKLYMLLLLKTLLNSHPLTCYNHSLTT